MSSVQTSDFSQHWLYLIPGPIIVCGNNELLKKNIPVVVKATFMKNVITVRTRKLHIQALRLSVTTTELLVLNMRNSLRAFGINISKKIYDALFFVQSSRHCDDAELSAYFWMCSCGGCLTNNPYRKNILIIPKYFCLHYLIKSAYYNSHYSLDRLLHLGMNIIGSSLNYLHSLNRSEQATKFSVIYRPIPFKETETSVKNCGL